VAAAPEVLSVGLVVADHVCAPVSHLPAAGELVTTDNMILTIGGGASNAAVDLRKMNVSVAIAASVGDDAFGRIVRDVLESNGIDTSALKVSAAQPTSQTLIVNVAGHDRRFIHLVGAYADFTAADIPISLAKRCKVLYLGYFLIMPNLRAEELIPVFQTVRNGGGKVVVDVATPGKRDYLSKLQKLLPHVDIFLPNQDEAELILGERDPLRQAEAFRKLGAKTVVITMGAEGSLLVNDRSRLRAGVYATECIDGSGGGDAFAAGFIYGVLKGMDEEGCLRVASALGASCVRAIGTTPGVFAEAECMAFIKDHTLKIERV
jgi:sugar/nucleoside kinase (ribokinase family)